MSKSSRTLSSAKSGVEPDDLGVILVCAFRYALGRKSYMPSLIADVIRRYWDLVPARERLLIQAELSRALNEHDDENLRRDIGWEIDVETWRRLAKDVDV